MTNVTNPNVATACTDAHELSMSELEIVSGGEGHTIGDTIHRILFGLTCILDGGTLVTKGDQLQCRG